MGERKHKCTHPGCQKTFNRRDYLERHAANHLDVKPFVCHECQRHFSRRDLYENHLTTRFHSRRVGLNQVKEEETLAHDQDGAGMQMSDHDMPLDPGAEMTSMVPDDDYFRDGIPLDFGHSVSASGSAKSSDIQAGLLNQSAPPDFDQNPYYSPLGGLENERWDYYRPFKRSPTHEEEEEEYRNHGNPSKRHDNKINGSTSTSENGGSEVSSESGGGSHTNTSDTIETSLTSGSNGSSNSRLKGIPETQPATPGKNTGQIPHGSAPAAAYKMWLIDRFQDDRASTKYLREPEGEDAEYDKMYEWFFQDNADNEKHGCVAKYTEATRLYKERTLKYQVANWPSTNAPQKSMPKVNEERTHLTMQILAAGSSQVILGGHDIDRYIETAWTKAHVVSYIVHRPTFDPNTAHPALVAVLVTIGMALSSDDTVAGIARAAAPNVSLFIYESLDQPEGPMCMRYAAPYVGHFQAFCLMFKYEPAIIGRDLYACSLIRAASCRRSAEKFIVKLIASVPQLGLVPGRNKPKSVCRREPVMASMTPDSYSFHQGYDPEAQWREWAAYEMCKRTVLFTVYYDGIISKCDTGHSIPEISLFNLDINCPVPDSVWHSRTSQEFFYAVGPSGSLSNVPYLGLIQSLLQSSPNEQGDSMGLAEAAETAPSFFAFRMVAHGLMNITSRLFGIFDKGERVMKALLGSLQPDMAIKPSPFFERHTQERLFHGLDAWFRRFERCYGNITERLFKINGSLGIKIITEAADEPGDETNQNSLPQYALYLVIYHYSSFIVVHEDLPVVLQVTTNLEKWLNQDGQLISRQKLLEFLYMPLYVQWSQSDESRVVVATGAKFLLWMDAATGQIDTKSWNQLFFSAVIFTSVIAIWIFDLVAFYKGNGNTLANYTAGPADLQDYKFMQQGLEYLWYLAGHSDNDQYTRDRPPVLSVLLMGACILYNRPYTQALYELMEQLICVLEPSLNPDRVRLVLEGAPEMFKARALESGTK